MEAAAAAGRPATAPEPAEPGQLDITDLPPPPDGVASKVEAAGAFCLQGKTTSSRGSLVLQNLLLREGFSQYGARNRSTSMYHKVLD